jgi:hypothetical protein
MAPKREEPEVIDHFNGNAVAVTKVWRVCFSVFEYLDDATFGTR